MSVSILIADDHDLIRRGLKSLLETRPGWEVCAEAADGRTAVELANKFKPQIADPLTITVISCCTGAPVASITFTCLSASSVG